MKPIHATLMAMAGLLVLMNSPASGQEIPLDPAAPPPKIEPIPKPAETPPPATTPAPSRRSDAPEGRRSNPRQQNEKPTAFIGVLTGNVPRELRAHFNLPEGFGLIVEEVMPDTPAKAAGMKVDDILIRFEDQKLVNMEQLQTLVRSKKKGDLVPLSLISNGQEVQLTVTIDERMMPTGPEEFRRGEGFLQPFGRGGPFFGDRGDPDLMNEMRESAERYQRQMREYQERMRDWNRDGGKGSMPPAPSWNGPGGRRDGGDRGNDRGSSSRGGPRDGEQRSERHEHREAANVTRSDDSGVYSLRREGDRHVFTAKPKDGQEQSWNLNSEEDRRAIPEPMKEKLKLLEEIRGNDQAPGSSSRGPDSKDEGRRPGPDSPARGNGL